MRHRFRQAPYECHRHRPAGKQFERGGDAAWGARPGEHRTVELGRPEQVRPPPAGCELAGQPVGGQAGQRLRPVGEHHCPRGRWDRAGGRPGGCGDLPVQQVADRSFPGRRDRPGGGGVEHPGHGVGDPPDHQHAGRAQPAGGEAGRSQPRAEPGGSSAVGAGHSDPEPADHGRGRGAHDPKSLRSRRRISRHRRSRNCHSHHHQGRGLSHAVTLVETETLPSVGTGSL